MAAVPNVLIGGRKVWAPVLFEEKGRLSEQIAAAQAKADLECSSVRSRTYIVGLIAFAALALGLYLAQSHGITNLGTFVGGCALAFAGAVILTYLIYRDYKDRQILLQGLAQNIEAIENGPVALSAILGRWEELQRETQRMFVGSGFKARPNPNIQPYIQQGILALEGGNIFALIEALKRKSQLKCYFFHKEILRKAFTGESEGHLVPSNINAIIKMFPGQTDSEIFDLLGLTSLEKQHFKERLVDRTLSISFTPMVAATFFNVHGRSTPEQLTDIFTAFPAIPPLTIFDTLAANEGDKQRFMAYLCTSKKTELIAPRFIDAEVLHSIFGYRGNASIIAAMINQFPDDLKPQILAILPNEEIVRLHAYTRSQDPILRLIETPEVLNRLHWEQVRGIISSSGLSIPLSSLKSEHQVALLENYNNQVLGGTALSQDVRRVIGDVRLLDRMLAGRHYALFLAVLPQFTGDNRFARDAGVRKTVFEGIVTQGDAILTSRLLEVLAQPQYLIEMIRDGNFTLFVNVLKYCRPRALSSITTPDLQKCLRELEEDYLIPFLQAINGIGKQRILDLKLPSSTLEKQRQYMIAQRNIVEWRAEDVNWVRLRNIPLGNIVELFDGDLGLCLASLGNEASVEEIGFVYAALKREGVIEDLGKVLADDSRAPIHHHFRKLLLNDYILEGSIEYLVPLVNHTPMQSLMTLLSSRSFFTKENYSKATRFLTDLKDAKNGVQLKAVEFLQEFHLEEYTDYYKKSTGLGRDNCGLTWPPSSKKTSAKAPATPRSSPSSSSSSPPVTSSTPPKAPAPATPPAKVTPAPAPPTPSPVKK